jgi:hypothetical protein
MELVPIGSLFTRKILRVCLEHDVLLFETYRISYIDLILKKVRNASFDECVK